MATVVITCFIFVSYDFKMDAEFNEKRRDLISRREKRWSMNSQRLEEIVAELMKPISDVRRTFDTDLSALLEEYLTEAGLHALDAEESDDDGSDTAAASAAAPNFPELALLLQQSASIYGRKVDLLYQHVLAVSDSLQNSTLEKDTEEGTSEAQTPSSRRKRKASTSAEFAPLELEGAAGVRREPTAPRPPPTLPRLYLELEPRLMSDRDVPLTDYNGESIGLLTDFHVTWRLQDGLLVEELKCSRSGVGAVGGDVLRPVPLAELQAAIEASSPPSPPPEMVPVDIELMPPPAAASSPLPSPVLPASPTPAPGEMRPPAPLAKLHRKRKMTLSMENLAGTIKLIISAEGRRSLRKECEFELPEEWVRGAVSRRRARILDQRARLLTDACDLHHDHHHDLPAVHLGFPGWSVSEAGAARAALTRVSAGAGGACVGGGAESDDDGFFEQSSLGDSDGSRVDDTLLNSTQAAPEGGEGGETAEWRVWQKAVVARAAQGEARGADVSQLAARVLDATHDHHTPFQDVLAAAAVAGDPTDVSKLFLATLFLANSGNVEIVPGPPLSLNSFSVRVLSRDPALVPDLSTAAGPS